MGYNQYHAIRRWDDTKKHEYKGVPIGPDGRKDSIEITTAMLLDNNLQTLEHIDIRVWINHPRRGDVMVEPVSPNGIESVLVWMMRQRLGSLDGGS